MNPISKLVLALAVATTGCAARRTGSVPATAATTQPAALVGEATAPDMLPLDQILPAPVLEAPATQPSARPPVDAIVHYANGRAALLDGRRQTAINEFEKAAELDPHSFEVFQSLGEAHLGGNIADSDSIDAFLKAAAIRPDDLHTRIQLGRQFLVKGNADAALRQLRLALQTTEYNRDDDQSAVADYFLARVLQQKGYDRAALDRYQILLTKLQNPSLELRGNPELAMLMSRPEVLYLQIGQLYEKHKEYDEALKMYEPAAQQDPANFDLQAKVVRALAAAGKRDEAGRRAAEIVTRFRADAQSLALMREVYKSIGKESAVIDELKRLRADRPDDRSLLFTEADVMKSMGREQEAKDLLADAWKKNPADIEVLRRLYSLYDQKDDTTGAMRVLIQALATDPDILREIMPRWADLIRSSRKNRVTVATLQRMEVPEGAEAA
jgi:tetratricopeptide (TPR) repeat protein